jgi:hypothetical protein
VQPFAAKFQVESLREAHSTEDRAIEVEEPGSRGYVVADIFLRSRRRVGEQAGVCAVRLTLVFTSVMVTVAAGIAALVESETVPTIDPLTFWPYAPSGDRSSANSKR